MRFVLLVLAVLQAAPPTGPPTARGDRFQIAVPQGWKVLTAGTDVVLEHSSGASLLIVRVEAARNLAEYAQQQAERIMSPLGFASLSDPKSYKDTHEEWIEYEIHGNRQTDHRRILYRALRRGTAYYGIVYEAGEGDFEALLTDAEGIASSVQALAVAPARRAAAPVKR
ncbi:MAG TPA: hypothetical protein VGK48_20695 [Terriglobia bacterium]|jgi:hypothetical protein